MGEKIKAAVIGAGLAAAHIHVPYLKANHDVELSAIVDPLESKAKFLAKKYRIPRIYKNHLEMLDKEKPQIVHVATPPWLHCEHSVDAMETGANVLCEKPMAASLEECDKMIMTAKKRGVKLMIGFMKRWNIGLEKIRDIINNNELGRAFFVFVCHTLNARMIQEKWRTIDKNRFSCGIALGLIHYIDALRWILGDVSSVYGTILNIFPKLVPWESFAVMNADFKMGVIANIILGTGPTYNDEELDMGGVFCLKGNIFFRIPGSYNFSAPSVIVQDQTGDWHHISFKTDPIGLTHWQYKKEIDYWIECVKKDKAVSPSGEDGRKAQEVIYALYKSWYEGKRVYLPLEKTPNLEDIYNRLTSESFFT